MKTDHSKQTSRLSAENKAGRDTEQKLEDLRLQIDNIDRQIVALLAKRQVEVQSVLSLKKTFNIPVYHPAREENLISDRRIQGDDAGLDQDYVEELYRLILRQSRAEQTARMAKKGVRDDATVLLVGGRGSM